MMVRVEPDVRRSLLVMAVLVSLLAGLVAAAALVVAFTVVGDPCPDFESEGPMAAPDSPYSRVMCDPAVTLLGDTMSQVEVPAILLVAAGVGALASVLVVALRPRVRRRRVLVAGVALVLLAPAACVVLAEVTLPRDCLSGRTQGGECGRDRELR